MFKKISFSVSLVACCLVAVAQPCPVAFDRQDNCSYRTKSTEPSFPHRGNYNFENEYEDLDHAARAFELAKLKRSMISSLLATHIRCGFQSPAHILYPDIYKMVWEFAKHF